MKLKAVKKSESAFTLVEVLAVMVIIGILVSLTIGLHGHVKERQKESVLKTEMAAIELALEEYKSKNSAYPSSEHWGIHYPSEDWNLVSFPVANTLYQSLCGENGYLKDIPENIEVNLFWSKSETSVPSEINSYGNYISDFLYQLSESYNFKFNTIDPIIDTDAELKAKISKIPKIPMTSGDYFYLGLNIIHNNRQLNIPYFDLNRRNYLETMNKHMGALHNMLAPYVNNIINFFSTKKDGLFKVNKDVVPI